MVLAGRVEGRWLVTFAMLAVALSTLATNIAANIVSPANGFANLAPQRISCRAGGYFTGVVGFFVVGGLYLLLIRKISVLACFASAVFYAVDSGPRKASTPATDGSFTGRPSRAD